MARGGYISTEIAVRKLNAVLGSRERARQILIDALVSEELPARGKPIPPEPPSCQKRDPMLLRDISTSFKPPKYGSETAIPGSFWTDAYPSEVDKWRLQEGFVFSSDSDPDAYSAVKLEEKTVNALVRKFDPERATVPKKSRQRKRTARWPEWIAALTTCVKDHIVHGNLTQQQVLDEVNNRLENWDLEPCKDPTMGPAASEVLKRLNELAATETKQRKT